MLEADFSTLDRSPGLDELLTTFAASTGHFSDLLDRHGVLRPHWATFARAGERLGHAELSRAQARVARQLHEDGVTYNLQIEDAVPHAWSLDVLPHIIPADEWDPLTVALRQRARLLEAIAADIYGEQRLLAKSLMPPAFVFAHPGFLRACHGVRPPGGTFLHLIAFDLARRPDGSWAVLNARTQAPSGAGYALENRLTIARLYPAAFRDLHVHRLAPFFRAMQETLLTGARGDGTPHVVLLTPGRHNETYFEHAYLSRYLGFTLAEGADLTVRNDVVYLKTAAGLRPVHAIVRRLDATYCDPVELRAESTLGVPGLVQAWRAGNVLVANTFGSAVLESPALATVLEALCGELLGERLRLPSPRGWWCGHAAALAVARERLAELVIRPAFHYGQGDSVFGSGLDERQRADWLLRLQARGDEYVLEEYVPLSHAPVWEDGRLQSRAVMLRVFLAADGHGDYHVLPGGLSRIAGSERDVVSGQRSGGSKDTWVLSPTPVERFSMLPGRVRVQDIARSERPVSSRVGEHLFWLGRYAERSENAARMLRSILTRLPQGDASVSAESVPVVTACRIHELLPAGAVVTSTPQFERLLIDGLFDAAGTQSLAHNVAQTVRVAGAVRDRLSSDNWRVLNRLEEVLSGRSGPAVGLAEALELLDHTILSLVAVGGLEMAHMTRDEGWRFMSLGRHLERVLYVITTAREVARSDQVEDPALLDWLLDLCDSIITYRARYMSQAEWLPVADLLLFDRRNPRSAAFQLSKLAKHVPLLPGGGLEDIAVRLEAISTTRLGDEQTGDLFPKPNIVGEFLAGSEQLALRLSDALTLRYFSHVDERAHATLL